MLRIGDTMIDPKAIIFDKDGTLMAFHVVWETWYRHLLAALHELVGPSAALERGMCNNLGVCQDSGIWDPVGPLTLASTREVSILVAGQVYQHTEATWPQSLAIAHRAEETSRVALDDENLVQPIGDLACLLSRLSSAGYSLAVATTDDRRATERNLETLGLMDYITAWVCGDDAVSLKPAPDMVLRLCETMLVSPEDTIVVGDTMADMDMAHAAGCALAVGVGTGAVPADLLAPHADVMLSDVHGIQLVEEG